MEEAHDRLLDIKEVIAIIAGMHGYQNDRMSALSSQFKNMHRIGFPARISDGSRIAYGPRQLSLAITAFELMRFQMGYRAASRSVAAIHSLVGASFWRAAAWLQGRGDADGSPVLIVTPIGPDEQAQEGGRLNVDLQVASDMEAPIGWDKRAMLTLIPATLIKLAVEASMNLETPIGIDFFEIPTTRWSARPDLNQRPPDSESGALSS